MRYLISIALCLCASIANAGIVVRTVASVVNDPNGNNINLARVTFRLYGGSDSAAQQGVASYSVQLNTNGLTVSNGSSPVAATATFVNNTGVNPGSPPPASSYWATPGFTNPNGPFTGSPGSFVGGLATFTGAPGFFFGDNIQIPTLQLPANPSIVTFLIGTVTVDFIRQPVGDFNVTLSAPSLSATFQDYRPNPNNGGNPSLFATASSVNGASATITGVTAIPEPSAGLLFLIGGAICGLRRRR